MEEKIIDAQIALQRTEEIFTKFTSTEACKEEIEELVRLIDQLRDLPLDSDKVTIGKRICSIMVRFIGTCLGSEAEREDSSFRARQDVAIGSLKNIIMWTETDEPPLRRFRFIQAELFRCAIGAVREERIRFSRGKLEPVRAMKMATLLRSVIG